MPCTLVPVAGSETVSRRWASTLVCVTIPCALSTEDNKEDDTTGHVGWRHYMLQRTGVGRTKSDGNACRAVRPDLGVIDSGEQTWISSDPSLCLETKPKHLGG